MTLESSTTGKVFLQGDKQFNAGISPTTELSNNHPFISFWKDFREKIVSTNNLTLLEAYTSVYAGNTSWKNGLSVAEYGKRIQQISDIINNHPPDIVIIDQKGWLHLRVPDHWRFISISKYWVDQWKLAMDFDSNRRLTLALETVLRATLVHEIAHWLFTLRVGYYSPEYINASDEDLSTQAEEEAAHKTTPKEMCAEWRNDPEAGDYVELTAGGGIVEFDLDRDDVYFRIAINSYWSPSTPFLLDMRRKGYATFVPDTRAVRMPHPSRKLPFGQPTEPLRARFCEGIEGDSTSDFIPVNDEYLKHGNDRILGPSARAALKRGSEQGIGLARLGFHY